MQPFLEPKVGYFTAPDLAAVRQSLFEQGLVAKVSVTHKCEPRKLSYSLPTGRLVITKENDYAYDIAAFLRHFQLPYHGSGLPAAVGQVMELLLRPKRTAFTQKKRLEQYHLQGGASPSVMLINVRKSSPCDASPLECPRIV